MFMYRGFFYLVGAQNRDLPKARRQVQCTPQIKNQVPYVRVNYKNLALFCFDVRLSQLEPVPPSERQTKTKHICLMERTQRLVCASLNPVGFAHCLREWPVR